MTAITTAGALQTALGLSEEPARQIANASTSAVIRVVLEHQQPVIIGNFVASLLLLCWWLTATARPARRPALRLANAAFGSWVLVEILVIWSVVLGILQQVSGLPHDAYASAAWQIIRTTVLKWLILSTLGLPIFQLGLGEWAYRVSARVTRTQANPTIAFAHAG